MAHVEKPKKSQSKTSKAKGAVKPSPTQGAMVVDDPDDLGTTAPNLWKPAFIQYYKLALSEQYGLYFKYTSAGLAITADGKLETDLKAFLQQVSNGQPRIFPFRTAPSAPHLLMTKLDCHFVIELDSTANWRFLMGHASMKVDKGRGNNYFLLDNIDSGGSSRGPKSDRTCHIVSFGAKARSPGTDENYPLVDHYSLYFECSQNFDPTLAIVLDPDIRNDGGTIPPLQLGALQPSKLEMIELE